MRGSFDAGVGVDDQQGVTDRLLEKSRCLGRSPDRRLIDGGTPRRLLGTAPGEAGETEVVHRILIPIAGGRSLQCNLLLLYL